MAIVRTFKDLHAWQRAHEFVLGVYRLTTKFPKEEIYGLTSQLRRAAVSVPANIAEGFTRLSPAEKVRFYNIAEGSLEESRYYLYLACELGYADSPELQAIGEETTRLIKGLIKSIKKASE